MANDNKHQLYSFLSDESGMFYRASQNANGDWSITKNAQPYPIKYNPLDLDQSPLEFATNEKYFSMVRSISDPLGFIKDGAAILRSRYYNGKGIEEKVFFTVIEWNGVRNLYELSYSGKIDFKIKKEDPKQGKFTVSTIDDSAWGVLSQKDEVVYSIECNATNPKAIRVLFDGLTLLNKYTYQTVQAPISDISTPDVWHFIPFVLINQDGDSAGILTKNQTASTAFSDINSMDALNPSFFLYTAYALPNVNIQGSIKFEWSRNIPSGDVGLILFFRTSTEQLFTVFCNQPAFLTFPNLNPGPLIPGHIYDIPFNFTFDLAAGESVFFVAGMFDNAANLFTINPIVTNIAVSTKTRPLPIVAYCLRPLDVLQSLVSKATNNRYTINSDYFTTNNKTVLTSGDALRQVSDAKIYTSFFDFFSSYSSEFWMALRVINGALFMEKVIEVYKQDSTIFDLGDLIDFNSEVAIDQYVNQIDVGGPDIDYRHPSGRLAFNATNSYSLPFLTIDKKLDLVTKYRKDCYDITFLILDYQGESTQDNSGDKDVYMVQITDDKGSAVDDIETFENINVDDAPLEPIIKLPFNNDVINYTRPKISGIATPGSTVNIYADSVLDGGTVADGDGNWSYILVNALSAFIFGVQTGIHVIDATYTDESAPVSTITITIYDDIAIQTQITYPLQDDSLYNNIPIIKGVAQQGANFNVFLDGVIIGNVTADESCRWQLQSPVIPNGNHVLLADTDFTDFNVDTDIDFPLITYIGSELDGFIIINNLPLIKGIAKPGTSVDLYLNYITYTKLNTTPIIADANGNWSYQVVPVNYIDPFTGIPVVVAPIRNGLSVVSTSLINHVVPINITGFLLSRPAYSSITGVVDNTVFNTELSPARQMINHYPLFASIMRQQVADLITFEKSSKNGNLTTILGGVTVKENANVPFSSLGTPLALLEYGLLKTSTKKTFADLLYNFSNGGLIKCNFRGTDLFFLPIGSMKINNLTNDVQEWKLLMSPLNTFNNLINLYKDGLAITLNNNTMFHSDYNTLHFVKYNFQNNPKYNFKEIYDDWFNNRNDAWLVNPEYIQKIQTTEVTIDQIITRGISDLSIKIFRCKDAFLIDTIDYSPVIPAPIPIPQVVMEASIDWTIYPNDQYFCVAFAGEVPFAISERIQTKDKWPNTVLIEASNSINKPRAFFSTGFKSLIRVEGLVKKWQPNVTDIVATEEGGDTETLYSLMARKRTLRFGTAAGLPDYLYLRVAAALILDSTSVENVAYTLDKDEKITPSDDVEGFPMYYYNVNVTPKLNEQGASFSPEDDIDLGVFLNIDGTAFGLPPETIINVELLNE